MDHKLSADELTRCGDFFLGVAALCASLQRRDAASARGMHPFLKPHEDLRRQAFEAGWDWACAHQVDARAAISLITNRSWFVVPPRDVISPPVAWKIGDLCQVRDRRDGTVIIPRAVVRSEPTEITVQGEPKHTTISIEDESGDWGPMGVPVRCVELRGQSEPNP